MSDRIELVRGSLEAFMRGDLEAALTPASEDVVSVRAAPLPDPQTYHGTDGVIAMWNDWTSQFSEFAYTFEGDRVVRFEAFASEAQARAD